MRGEHDWGNCSGQAVGYHSDVYSKVHVMAQCWRGYVWLRRRCLVFAGISKLGYVLLSREAHTFKSSACDDTEWKDVLMEIVVKVIRKSNMHASTCG